MADDPFDLQATLAKYAKKPSDLAKPELVLLYGPPGGGKGIIYGTPVYTPKGSTSVEDLQVGDQVIGSDGKPTTVYGFWDRGVLPVYEVAFNDGASVTVDGDHLWTVQTSKGTWVTIPTSDIIDRFAAGTRGLRIPTTGPVEHDGVDLPLPPYMMGALIADGYLAGAAIQWTKNDQNVVDAMQESAASAGFSVYEVTRESSTARQWKIDHENDARNQSNVRRIVHDIGLNELSGTKFIPEEYFRATVADRWELVHGLFDGDGRIRPERNSAHYHTVSEQLSKDVQRLLWSLGISASRDNKVRGDGTWGVHVLSGHEVFKASKNVGKNTESVRPNRRIVSVTPAGEAPVRCIAVEAADQLYVTKDYIVTHNTYTSATASEVPGVKKVLILDTEGSTSGALLGFDDDIVQIVSVERENSIESFKFLNTILDKVFDPNTVGTYDVVIIDTFDVAQDWATDFFFDTAKTGKTGEKDGFEVWRNVKSWSIETARSLKRIDALGVLVVHDREEKEKSGAITTKLNLVGSARDVLPGIPDVVGYIYRELEEDGAETTYGEFASQGGKVTKNRFRFPPLVKNPNLAKLFEYIAKNQKEAK